MRGVDILYKEEFETTENSDASNELNIDDLANKVAEKLVGLFNDEPQTEPQTEPQNE